MLCIPCASHVAEATMDDLGGTLFSILEITFYNELYTVLTVYKSRSNRWAPVTFLVCNFMENTMVVFKMT